MNSGNVNYIRIHAEFLSQAQRNAIWLLYRECRNKVFKLEAKIEALLDVQKYQPFFQLGICTLKHTRLGQGTHEKHGEQSQQERASGAVTKRATRAGFAVCLPPRIWHDTQHTPREGGLYAHHLLAPERLVRVWKGSKGRSQEIGCKLVQIVRPWQYWGTPSLPRGWRWGNGEERAFERNAFVPPSRIYGAGKNHARRHTHKLEDPWWTRVDG